MSRPLGSKNIAHGTKGPRRVALRRVFVLGEGIEASGVYFVAAARYVFQTCAAVPEVLLFPNRKAVEDHFPGGRLVTAYDETRSDYDGP